MRVKNSTLYDSRQLRRLFSACLTHVRRDHIGDNFISKLKVDVVYSRQNYFISGWANVRGTRMRLRLPRQWQPMATASTNIRFVADFSQALAGTFIHELGHNLGCLRHGGPDNLCTIEHLYADWVRTSISTVQFPVEQKLPGKPDPSVRMNSKLERARKNLKAAATRLKRAKTIHTKWERTVKRLEKAREAKTRQIRTGPLPSGQKASPELSGTV